MTVCQKLDSREKNGVSYTAWALLDKYTARPRYEITVANVGSSYAYAVIKTARTTWRKKLAELTE